MFKKETLRKMSTEHKKRIYRYNIESEIEIVIEKRL
jgi:hypothetical protein